MKDLINKLNEAAVAYYKGNPVMSDSEYDKLYDELVKMEGEEGIIYADSPTQNVGVKPVDFISTVKHDHPMLSLSKVHGVEDIEKFATHNIVSMFKADGLTVSCTYEDGKLTKLETRGDGAVGNDVLFHAVAFKNLPLRINRTGKYVIDGEAVIKWDDFENIKGDYKHPRNLAAGTLNQLDPNVSKTRELRFFAWDVIEGGSFNSLDKNLYEAEKLGFDTVAHYLVYPNDIKMYNFEKFLGFMKKLAQEENFPIDGLVFKYDDISYGKSLGMTGHHPKNAIAYKYEDSTYETKCVDVDWTLGKTGVIVPTLIVEPVDCGGVTVEKASCHNLSIFNQLAPSRGATAFIYRANDVIPQVDHIEDDGTEPFDIPDKCPVCGGEVKIVKTENTMVLKCTNPNCKGKLLGKLNAFVSKKGMDIKGFSEQTLDKFISLGWLRSFIDIYNLYLVKSNIMNLDGFGKTSVDKLLKAIEDSKQNVELRKFITSLSIPGIGEGQSKEIVKVFPTWDEFITAIQCSYMFTNIDGIGEVLNYNIYEWYRTCYVQDHIKELAALMNFKSEETNDNNTNGFDGLTFVVTGSVYKFTNRNEVKSYIENRGGKVAGSVSKNTNYLINNDINSTSSKNQKAKELNIPIITEDDLIRMSGEGEQ